MITLIETVTSTCKKDVVYGNKGDRVSLISKRGEVLLVMDKKGNGFPVRIEKTDYKAI